MDGFKRHEQVNPSSWGPAFALLLAMGILMRAEAQTCDCVASDYYASESLPLVSIVTSCPDWPASIATPGLRGAVLYEAVDQYRGELYLNAKNIPYKDEAVSTFKAVIQGKTQDCETRIRVSDQALSGWNLVLMPFWYTPSTQASGRGTTVPAPVRLKGNLLAALPGTVFLPLEEAEAMQVQSFFKGGGLGLPPAVPGATLAVFPTGFSITGIGTPTYTPYLGSARRAPRGTILTKNLVADMEKTLQANGWGEVAAGAVQIEGRWFPAVLKRYGTPGKVYAYYGRFKDGEAARHYGFTPSDQLYFSRRELVPPGLTDYFESDLRFGSKIFLREQVLPNRRLLEWHSDCRCSDLAFDPDDRNVAKVDARGNWTPVSPDNMENSNPLVFRECPDERTYFSLYQMCVEEQMKDDPPAVDARGRVDYSDYVASRMGATPAYKSLNPDGTLDGENLSVDNMPETPAYYDKQGERLNPTREDLMDPLDPNTTFFGYRYGPKSWDDWEGSKEKQYRINPRIRNVVNDMQSLFDEVIVKGKEPLLNLFQISFLRSEGATTPSVPPVEPANGPIRVQASYKSLTLDLAVDDATSLGQPLRILNPSDKYLEYKTARTFITQSTTGKPLKIRDWVDEREVDDFVLGSDLDDLKFQVYWTYSIFAYDKRGDPVQAGTLRISNTFWRNADESSMKLVGKWTNEVGMEGGKLLSSADGYDLNSREAHTDLKSLNDRDPVTFEEKGDAMARIAFYIAVSEGLDIGMKWLYQQKNQAYLYESAKRAENMVGVKQAAKLAYAFYKGYIEWRRLMDILAEIRDSRRSLERAFSRFKRSGSLLVDHFVNLDYSKIRPTNVADVFPTRAMRYFDWSVQDLKNELVHFEAALHALSLDLDRFMDGSGKRTLAYMYRETAGSLAQVTAKNDRDRERTHAALKSAQGVLARSDDNTSNYLRLSALTRLALQKTRNTQIKSLEASTSGLRNVLLAVQSDSRDWLTMQDYVTLNLAGSPGAFLKAYHDENPDAVARQFDVNPILRNTWVDDHAGDEP